MFSSSTTKACVCHVAAHKTLLWTISRTTKILLPFLFAAAVSPPILGQVGEDGFEPVVASLTDDDLLLAQQPKPKAQPAAPTPAKKAPAAEAKKPPRRGVEPDEETSTRPAPTRRNLVPDLGLLAFRTPSLRLASVPNMLGDFFNQGVQVQATDNVSVNPTAAADLALAGGGYRLKVAENNKALPMNRCYFMYNHFHNALNADADMSTPGSERDYSVDRFTIGLERMFLDDLWSVDVRMPFAASQQFTSGGLAIESGSVGNLQVTLKRLLALGEYGSVAAGLAIDTPTGSDVTGKLLTTKFTVQNEAVHLAPYVGFLHVPNDRIFCQGFLQVDVPTNGNRIDFVDTGSPPSSGAFGTYDEQTLLYADISAGYWLCRNPDARLVTGLASLVEFHYTTTLTDADVVLGSVPASLSTFQFGNLLGRMDVTNVTVGLHSELFGHTTLRVAGVFPLQDDLERPFDSEVVVSLNLYR